MLLTLSALSAIVARAQERLTYLDWEIIASDTLCPVYSEAVPLESDYQSNDYRIVLEYPTWGKLSSKELALARKHAHNISDSIAIEHYITVSRGKGLLNYHFVPIIKKGKEYRKLLSAKVLISPVPKAAQASFMAVYLTFRRSAWYAIAYAANDIILIILWIFAAVTDVSYISVIICFAMFLVNDIYGFINWKNMSVRQNEG